MKTCFKCNKKQPLINFYKHKQTADGYLNKCKTCTKKDTSEGYKKNLDKRKEYEKKRMKLPHRKALSKKVLKNWRNANPNLAKLQVANRRARKRKATPSWANLEKIREFYLNCPKGYAVDHIIPFYNELVCGLHVENNLQYLTKSENSSKGTKFTPYIEIPF